MPFILSPRKKPANVVMLSLSLMLQPTPEPMEGFPAGTHRGPSVVVTRSHPAGAVGNRTQAARNRRTTGTRNPPNAENEAMTLRAWLHESWNMDDYRHALAIAILVLATQSALIATLVLTRRRYLNADANLSLAAEAAGIGLWQRPAGSTGITATSRWRKIFGCPESGPLTLQNVYVHVHPEDRIKMREAIDKSARDGQPFNLEHRVSTPDGKVRWIATYGRAERGPNGSGTRGASMDITPLKEAAATTARQREELAHLARVSSLGVLSGSLAHELNQPLCVILSNAQAAEFMLNSDNPDLAELKDIVRDIISEDRRAGEVIQRLRALLRRGESIRQHLDLNEPVLEVLKLVRSDLISRGVTVQAELQEDPPPLFADRVQIQQVLLNLITNACDAMAGNAPAKRNLTIRTSSIGGTAMIEVSDRGVGLPEDIDRLFEAFNTTKQQGLGMGLAICRTLINAQNGRIWAEPHLSGGASFFISLPISSPP